jgi:hypothetical protein
MSTPHSAGATERRVVVETGLKVTATRPVLTSSMLAAVPVTVAFVLQVLEAADVLGTAVWLRALLVGVGGLSQVLAALWAHMQVTPTAQPRDDEGNPLVPAIGDEAPAILAFPQPERPPASAAA